MPPTIACSIDNSTSTLRLADLATGETMRELRGCVKDTYWLAKSVNENLLAVACKAGVLILETSTLHTKLTLDIGCTRVLAFTPDGKWLVTGSDDTYLRLYDAVSGSFSFVADCRKHTRLIRTIAVSPSSKKMVSGSSDKMAYVWSLPTLALLNKIVGSTEAFYTSLFMSESIMASGSFDRAIRIWDIDSGTLLHELQEHQGAVGSLEISPSGKLFASGSLDKTVKIYNTQTYTCLRTIECADEQTLLVAVNEYETMVIDVESGLNRHHLAKLQYATGLLSTGALTQSAIRIIA